MLKIHQLYWRYHLFHFLYHIHFYFNVTFILWQSGISHMTLHVVLIWSDVNRFHSNVTLVLPSCSHNYSEIRRSLTCEPQQWAIVSVYKLNMKWILLQCPAQWINTIVEHLSVWVWISPSSNIQGIFILHLNQRIDPASLLINAILCC